MTCDRVALSERPSMAREATDVWRSASRLMRLRIDCLCRGRKLEAGAGLTKGRECGFRSCVCESHSCAMTRAAASFSFGKARGKPDGVLRVRLSSLMSHEPPL